MLGSSRLMMVLRDSSVETVWSCHSLPEAEDVALYMQSGITEGF